MTVPPFCFFRIDSKISNSLKWLFNLPFLLKWVSWSVKMPAPIWFTLPTRLFILLLHPAQLAENIGTDWQDFFPGPLLTYFLFLLLSITSPSPSPSCVLTNSFVLPGWRGNPLPGGGRYRTGSDHIWRRTYTAYPGVSASSPHSGDSASSPHYGDLASSPHYGDLASSPHYGDLASSPHSGDSASSPHSAYLASSPDPGAGFLTPHPHSVIVNNFSGPHGFPKT